VATIDDVYDYLVNNDVVGKLNAIHSHVVTNDLAGKLEAVYRSTVPTNQPLPSGTLFRLQLIFDQIGNLVQREDFNDALGTVPGFPRHAGSVLGDIDKILGRLGLPADRPTTEPETVLGLLMGFYTDVPEPE